MVSLRDRFEAKYIPEPNSGCWIWMRGGTKQGYGIIRDGKSRRLAHRVSYEIYVCDPADKNVLHKCDNPSCVNPEHLWLGTIQENSIDCVKKGRHPKQKLSREAISDILTKRLSRKAYARLYGVCQSAVGRVQIGKTWAWLNG